MTPAVAPHSSTWRASHCARWMILKRFQSCRWLWRAFTLSGRTTAAGLAKNEMHQLAERYARARSRRFRRWAMRNAA